MCYFYNQPPADCKCRPVGINAPLSVVYPDRWIINPLVLTFHVRAYQDLLLLLQLLLKSGVFILFLLSYKSIASWNVVKNVK